MASRVLTIRTDAIGDAILWGGAWEPIRARYPSARLGVLCRESVAPLYEHCPFVDDVLPIRYDDARFSDDDRVSATRVANDWAPDLLLDPIRSKAPNALSIVSGIRAARSVALEPDDANRPAGQGLAAEELYTSCIRGAEEPCELAQHAAFLEGLGGYGGERVAPRVWLGESDRRQAAALLGAAGVEPGRAVAIAPRGRWRYKTYPAWGAVLERARPRLTNVDAFVVIGGPEAGEDAKAIRAVVPQPDAVLDLTGRTPIRVAIAICGMVRACIGTDTFAIHAACAQGVPNAAILGGGHPGRFLPYSPLTRVAMRPLDCFGCDWACAYERAHCVADLRPSVFADAVVDAVEVPAGNAARLFMDDEQTAVAVGAPRVRPASGWVRLTGLGSSRGPLAADIQGTLADRRPGRCDSR